VSAWQGPVVAALGFLPPGPVVDIGAGSGMWSSALAAWTRRPVVAVEPSAGMRAEALHIRRGPPVHQVGGVAGALSLRDGSGAAAWLSTVIHHVGDIGRCARELRRVLAPGAPVLIRSAFPGRHDGVELFRFFPAARRVAERFPSVEVVTTAFQGAGFAFAGLQRVEEPPTLDYRSWRAQLPTQRHADTTLVGLTDAEFDAGLRAIDRAIAAGDRARPVGLDLLSFR
jgi:SAM-dependent methyltransferase